MVGWLVVEPNLEDIHIYLYIYIYACPCTKYGRKRDDRSEGEGSRRDYIIPLSSSVLSLAWKWERVGGNDSVSSQRGWFLCPLAHVDELLLLGSTHTHAREHALTYKALKEGRTEREGSAGDRERERESRHGDRSLRVRDLLQ
jgi:hypothetical protein